MKSLKMLLRFAAAFLLGGLIGFGAIMLCFVVFGDATVDEFLGKFQQISWYSLIGATLFSLLSLMLAFLLQVVLHEGGHLVCGVLTGYRFVSFRILQFTLLRRKGHYLHEERYSGRFRRSVVLGTPVLPHAEVSLRNGILQIELQRRT